jgi:methionyl aminopeptidase
MRIQTKSVFSENSVIHLKNDDWLQKQRVAGKVVAATLSFLEAQVKDKTIHSMLELNALAEDIIEKSECTATFKNYKGFPAGVCISINNQLVHGIPTDYKLQEGDVVSFDLGATYQGAIADSALTCIYGTPKSPEHIRLIQATEEALMAGIAAIKIGNRLGCIGHAINKHFKNSGFESVTNYGGHGLCWNTPHAAPFVANKAELNEGIRIVSGLSIAIEPMGTIGSPTTKVLDDGWTVITNNINNHVEHSIFVHSDHVEIITWRENEQTITKPRFYFN